jgi:hypothetical protein
MQRGTEQGKRETHKRRQIYINRTIRWNRECIWIKAEKERSLIGTWGVGGWRGVD